MKLSLGQAAERAGVSKATIHRAVKSGKLSAEKVDGQYEIDPSEIARVYGDTPKKRNGGDDAKLPVNGEVFREIADKETEIKVLQVKLEAALEKVRDRDVTIDRLETQIETDRAEKMKLIEKQPTERRRFLGIF